ncbi:phage holin family protein [Scandinavium sp.]|uniref:phage holin family protein n=1 Tax=Scandinavium sp. TaxID=2830653 RepID=UPI0039C8E4E8
MVTLVNVSSSRVVLLELEILITVLAIGGWGGFVSFLMKKGTKNTEVHRNVMECLAQIVISCFSGFILSIMAIEKELSFNLVMLAAGVGGVFATPIIRLIGDKVKNVLSSIKIDGK